MLKKLFKRLLGKVDPLEEDIKYLKKNGCKIGQNVTINSGCSIDTGWPWLISIGDDVVLAPNVTILAHDASSNVAKCGTKLGKVEIGNNVFIGTRSVILCNVKIGDNVVVGAGSVVSKDLPSDGVYAGVPAKRICSIQEYREKLLKLREERPDFSKIRAWDTWRDSTDEERETMLRGLADGIGFI